MDTKTWYELSFIIYHGISQKLDEAIANPKEVDIQLLQELVDYYKNNYILSAKYLIEKLDTIKHMEC